MYTVYDSKGIPYETVWNEIEKDKTLNPEFPGGTTGCPNQKDKTITCSICSKCWNKKIQSVVFKQH